MVVAAGESITLLLGTGVRASEVVWRMTMQG